MKEMIKDEEYICFLKRVIACVSNGDYYSVKELSQLELEKMEKKQKTNKRRILIKDRNKSILKVIKNVCIVKV